ncbi:MAG TPA: multicopper oxidase domain-containing protein [Bacteroidia bacterium]|jgi:FtsP/CotA-like multicopper oxidase with cupredoxin domain|nr:multicopper oxidase domain-containing protein [Bacteroidia bacterium]
MSKKQHYFLVVLLSFSATVARCAVIERSLYINRGQLETVNQTQLPYIAFNSDRFFNAMNSVIHLNTTDQLILKVINNDTIVHGFEIQRTTMPVVIAPADSIIDTLQFNAEGVFIYFDSYQYPKFRYLGEAGMICVDNSITAKKFYWNLKEHQNNYNELLNLNKGVSWSDYSPDYFTINSFSFPYTLDDTSAVVHVNVGDTVHIAIANTGQSAHSIHFHGFHCKILYSTHPQQIGWIKDTFPINSMETMQLELIPDKSGHYSVHDHNLTAITGGGLHPKGMLILMAID